MAEYAGPGLGHHGEIWDPESETIKKQEGPGLGHHGDYWNQEKGTIEQHGDTKGSSSKKSSGGYSASDMLKSAGIPKSEKKNLFKKYGVDNTPDLLAAMAAEESAEKQRRLEMAEDIGKAWDPIFEELDRQIGALPGQQRQYEDFIGQSAESQLESVGLDEASNITSLEQERKRGLRDLEEDIRNMLEAAGKRIGVAGAGSSSAALQASEAVTRAGQKSRGSLMETVANRIGEIKTLATKQRQEINTWKNNKLFEIMQSFTNQMNSLRMESANAKGARAKAIEELKFNVEQEFAGRLRELDNMAVQYQQSIDMWEMQRAAQLQNYAASQAGSVEGAQYDIEGALDAFNDLVKGGTDPQAAAEWVQSAYGVLLPSDRAAGPAEEEEVNYRIQFGEDGEVYYVPTDPLRGQPQVGQLPGYEKQPGLLERLGF